MTGYSVVPWTHGVVYALASIGLAGCAAGLGGQATTQVIAPEKGEILFGASAFEGTKPRRVRFTDIWQTEEYALFRGQGAQAEMIYSSVVDDARHVLVLNYTFPVEASVDTWNFARASAGNFGEWRLVQTPIAEFSYKPFALAGKRRSCVGFSAQWDERLDDYFTRPGKVLFGYYCAKEGDKLGADQAEKLVRQLAIRSMTRRFQKSHRKTATNPAGNQAGAVEIAQGPSPSADTGNAGFPFKFAQYLFDAAGGEGESN